MRRPLPVLALMAVLAAGTCSAATTPPNVALTAATDAQGGSLAVDPTDPSRLAIAYSTGRSGVTGSCVVARSRDAGRTWESEVVAGGTGKSLPNGATHCADPVLAFAPEGMLYLAYDVSQLGGPGRVYLTSSTDRGATFRTPVALADAAPGGGDFEPAIAAGPSHGIVSVAFERYSDDFDSAAVLAVSSDDAGRTLSAPVQVSPAAQNAVNGRAALAVDRGGSLYVAWVDASDVDFDGSGTARVEVTVSGDGGRTFAAPSAVASLPSGCGPNDDCGNRYPAVGLAAGADGVVDLAWSSGAYADPTRIHATRSLDSGRRWARPTELPVPNGDVDRDETSPSLAVAPDGRVDLAWAAQARDSDDGLLDVYLAYSVDGGATFSKAIRLDEAPTNTQRAGFEPTVGVAASNGAAHASWQGAGLLFTRLRDSRPPQIPSVVGPRSVRGASWSLRLGSSDDFTPRGALRFRCAFDAATLHACHARYKQPLAPGLHVFRARAVDRAGNGSPIRTVTVRVG